MPEVEELSEVVAPQGEQTAALEKPAEPPKPVEDQMLDGIKAVLKPADPEAEKIKTEQAKVDAALAEANKGKTPEEIAAAKAATDTEAKKKAEAEEEAKLKGKKSDDFQLSDEEKKVWKQETQRRFNELRGFAKHNEAEVSRLTQENTGLMEARDKIMGLFEENQVEPNDLVMLLDYNKRVKSGDLAGALKIVDEARIGILKAMGKEAPGVDLLAEFPDLKAKVDAQELARENALEVAAARRRDKAQQQAEIERQAQERDAGVGKNAQEEALASIERWTKEIAKTDIDYKKKEEKVLARLPGILKEYSADKWLSTIKLLYESIEVAKPSTPTNGGGQPLRPSGAKPGAKTFTELTPEALRAGLGYPTT